MYLWIVIVGGLTGFFAAMGIGANDVANAIGPYAAIVTIYMNNGEMTNRVDMGANAYLILAMGGIGITIGLLLYGYKIIKAIGVKLCCITPSRGFSIELGSATILELLDAQLAVLQASSTLVTTKYDTAIQRANLDQLLGTLDKKYQ